MALAHITVGLRRRGGNISEDLSLFVLLYNTNFMNKLKYIFLIKQNKIHWVYTFFIYCRVTHFPLRRKVGQISKRKRVIYWSSYCILLVYDLKQISQVYIYILHTKPLELSLFPLQYKMWEPFSLKSNCVWLRCYYYCFTSSVQYCHSTVHQSVRKNEHKRSLSGTAIKQ